MRRLILVVSCTLVLALPGTGVAANATSKESSDRRLLAQISVQSEDGGQRRQPGQRIQPSIPEREQQQHQRDLRERLRQETTPEQRQQRPEDKLPGQPQPGPRREQDRQERAPLDRQLLPNITPEESRPPLHDPQQGDPLRDRPQPSPSQPLEDDPDDSLQRDR